MGMPSTRCAYLIRNKGVSTELAKEVSKWLEDNNIISTTSWENDDLYMRDDLAEFSHLFFVYESNDVNKVAKRIAKHIKYANSIGMPCYMIYKRHCDNKLQIYSSELVKDDRLSFGKNVTSNVITNYTSASKAYQESLKLDIALEKYLFIEQSMPSSNLTEDAYKRKIEYIKKRIKLARETRREEKDVAKMAKQYNAKIMFEEKEGIREKLFRPTGYFGLIKHDKRLVKTKRSRFETRNNGWVKILRQYPIITGTARDVFNSGEVFQDDWFYSTGSPSSPIEKEPVILNKRRKYHLLRKK